MLDSKMYSDSPHLIHSVANMEETAVERSIGHEHLTTVMGHVGVGQ